MAINLTATNAEIIQELNSKKTVVANNNEATTETLTKLKVGDTNYAIGEGIKELTTQYVRIYDLNYGIYRWNYSGQKYLYYQGQSGTTTGAVGNTSTNNFIIFVYNGYNALTAGGTSKSYLIFGNSTLTSNPMTGIPMLYYGDSSMAANSTTGVFYSGSLNPVTANDTSTSTTVALTSLKVGNTNYSVGSGSTAGIYTSSGIYASSSSASTSTVNLSTGQTLKAGDLVIGVKLNTGGTAIAGSCVIVKVSMIISTMYYYSVIYDSTVAGGSSGGGSLYSHEVWIAFGSNFTLILSYIDRSSTPIDDNTVGNIYEPVLTGTHGSYRVEQGYGWQNLVNIGLRYDPTLFEFTTVFWDTNGTNIITIVDWTSDGSVIDDYVYEITGSIADDYI